MKTLKITILICIIFTTNIYSQLKVVSNGDVGIGNTNPSNLNGWNRVLDVRGTLHSKILTTTSGAIIRTGLFSHSSWYEGAGFVGTESNHDFYIMANYIPRIKIRNYNGHVGINGYVSDNYWFYVTGDCRADSWSTYSDSTAKREIKVIENPEKIKELRPVQFKWKEDKYPYRDVTSRPDSNQLKKVDDRLNYGFIAQEVRTIFPDIVTEEENGELNMNYDALIPMLVDCYKRMDDKIEIMQEIITKQEVEIINLINKQIDNSTKSATLDINEQANDEIGNKNIATLYQNMPNPFNKNTEIMFFISKEAKRANLYIYDMQGNQKMKFDISTRGTGNISINGAALSAGLYLYTLIVDDAEIDTKRMILTSE